MKILIETDSEKINKIEFEDADDGQATFENVTAIIFCLLENFTHQVKESLEDDTAKAALYDYVAGACDQFCARTFPDIIPPGFELSDAALIYAEDMIINEAEKKGITYKEALAQFESKAKEYVNSKTEVLKA